MEPADANFLDEALVAYVQSAVYDDQVGDIYDAKQPHDPTAPGNVYLFHVVVPDAAYYKAGLVRQPIRKHRAPDVVQSFVANARIDEVGRFGVKNLRAALVAVRRVMTDHLQMRPVDPVNDWFVDNANYTETVVFNHVKAVTIL